LSLCFIIDFFTFFPSFLSGKNQGGTEKGEATIKKGDTNP
jgi:hypothetical protein